MIIGYIHIYAFGQWKEILKDQLDTIMSSGILNVCNRIELCHTHNELFPLPDPKLQWTEVRATKFEFPTLTRLYRNRELDPDGLSFYIHLKGVSKTPEYLQLVINECAWRKYMEYFVIGKYQDCIEALKSHDICGVYWRDRPFPHFSGNFWWARNDYLATLDHPNKYFLDRIDYKDLNGSNRSLAEFWIGSGNPRFKSLHTNSMNLYLTTINVKDYCSKVIH